MSEAEVLLVFSTRPSFCECVMRGGQGWVILNSLMGEAAFYLCRRTGGDKGTSP